MSDIPYDEICKNGDRSWTMRLLEALKDPELSEEDRDETVNALQMLDDPRCIEPLTSLLVDTTNAAAIREAAGDVLGWIGQLPDNDTLVKWWTDGDDVLRDLALWQFDTKNSDIVIPIASDPDHPYHLTAINTLRFGFEMPEHQELSIRALSHPDPRVRKAAAINLKWSEAIKAEDALIRTSRDPDTEVAVEACTSLFWYPTQRTLRHLKEIAENHPDEAVRGQAQYSFENVFGDLTNFLKSDYEAYMRQWLEPVWDIVEEQERNQPEDEEYATEERKRDPDPIPTLLEIITIIDNPDSSLEGLGIYRSNWKGFPQQERTELTRRFINHGDYTVREHATSILSEWNDQASLIQLLDDPEFFVIKGAIYNLGKTTPPNQDAADIIWKHIEHDHRTTEALSAYVKHERPEQAIPRLYAIANDVGETEGLRARSVLLLADLKAIKEIKALLRFLKDEPPVTWHLHIRLLEVAYSFEITPPSLSHLRDVDNADLQYAIAPFMTLNN